MRGMGLAVSLRRKKRAHIGRDLYANRLSGWTTVGIISEGCGMMKDLRHPRRLSLIGGKCTLIAEVTLSNGVG